MRNLLIIPLVLFTFGVSGQNWSEIIKAAASDQAAHDWFGRDVAIFGDVAIVGAVGAADEGLNTGAAYIFELIGGVWTETQKNSCSKLKINACEIGYYSFANFYSQ